MGPDLSLRALVSYASSFVSQIPLQIPNALDSNPFAGLRDSSAQPTDVVPYVPLSGAPTCPIDGPLSCHNSTPAADSCCFVAPSGRILLTQFWDTVKHPNVGEQDWTLHGLWPDLCDGSYDAYCGMTPHFANITEILQHYDQDALVKSMNRYWVADRGDNAHLWAHEYNKHASCINTLRPSCYGDAYAAGVEVVDYFTRAFGLFRTLDTYTALERAGVVPDHDRTYARDDVARALEAYSGGKVTLRCLRHRHQSYLHEAWYTYFLKGNLQSGEFVPAGRDDRLGGSTNCGDTLKYLPKRSLRGAEDSDL